MTEGASTPRYRARVRFAECDAWGEMQLFALQALFDAAVADAFAPLGVDWRQLTHPAQALRAGGFRMTVVEPPRCDDEIDFELTDARFANAALEVRVVARRARGGPELASAELVYVGRAGPGGATRPLPPELSTALSRLAGRAASAERAA